MEKWIVIESIATSLSVLIAVIAIYKSVQLSKQQMLLEKRQFLLPLWTELQQLNEIDPINPVWVDVIKAVNLLELIAISWEGQLIDENIIRRMYSRLYLEMYENIKNSKNPPKNISKDGNQMLLDSPSITRLYNILLTELADKNKLLPL